MTLFSIDRSKCVDCRDPRRSVEWGRQVRLSLTDGDTGTHGVGLTMFASHVSTEELVESAVFAVSALSRSCHFP